MYLRGGKGRGGGLIGGLTPAKHRKQKRYYQPKQVDALLDVLYIISKYYWFKSSTMIVDALMDTNTIYSLDIGIQTVV